MQEPELSAYVLQADLHQRIVIASQAPVGGPVHAFGSAAIAVQDASLPTQPRAQFLGPARRPVASAFFLRGVAQPVASAAGKVLARRVQHCHPLAASRAGKPAALPAQVTG